MKAMKVKKNCGCRRSVLGVSAIAEQRCVHLSLSVAKRVFTTKAVAKRIGVFDSEDPNENCGGWLCVCRHQDQVNKIPVVMPAGAGIQEVGVETMMVSTGFPGQARE